MILQLNKAQMYELHSLMMVHEQLCSEVCPFLLVAWIFLMIFQTNKVFKTMMEDIRKTVHECVDVRCFEWNRLCDLFRLISTSYRAALWSMNLSSSRQCVSTSQAPSKNPTIKNQIKSVLRLIRPGKLLSDEPDLQFPRKALEKIACKRIKRFLRFDFCNLCN
jgi:hypothetical protein